MLLQQILKISSGTENRVSVYLQSIAANHLNLTDEPNQLYEDQVNKLKKGTCFIFVLFPNKIYRNSL